MRRKDQSQGGGVAVDGFLPTVSDLTEVLEYVRNDYTLAVTNLDRLGRSVRNLKQALLRGQ